MSVDVTWLIQKLASPKMCYEGCCRLQPWIMVVCLLTLTLGLVDGLFFAPPDYQQGDVYRIMFLHVPAAILSLGIYIVMTVAVIMYFIWKIKVADIIAKVSAPLGAMFTLITLITGALWGKPTWGTFWIWDARLTSELILLFIYFGMIALRSAIPEPVLAARASGVMTLVGMVNIPIVHYSVLWWNTLHQGATILKLGMPSISPHMLMPLLLMIVAYIFYYLWMLCIKIRYELLVREKKAHWVKELKQC